MNWKSTAAVSGAGLLATWLASAPPASTPASSQAVRTPESHAATDIVREADRLQTRVRGEVEYAQPLRNPFRFGERTRAAGSGLVASAPAAAPVVAPVPEPLRVKLSGIAIDTVDGREQRTAILNTPSGLVFAHEGDDVAGNYKVGKIGEDAVDLIKTDGSVLQLR